MLALVALLKDKGRENEATPSFVLIHETRQENEVALPRPDGAEGSEEVEPKIIRMVGLLFRPQEARKLARNKRKGILVPALLLSFRIKWSFWGQNPHLPQKMAEPLLEHKNETQLDYS